MQSIRTQSQFSFRTQTPPDSPTEILRTNFANRPSFRDDRIIPAKTKQKATNCLNKTFAGDMIASTFRRPLPVRYLAVSLHITTCALSQMPPLLLFCERDSVCVNYKFSWSPISYDSILIILSIQRVHS